MDVQLERQGIWQPSGGMQHDLTLNPTSGTGYFAYIRTTKTDITVNHVNIYVGATAGAGTQAAELGLFTTPRAPCRSAQSLTPVASGVTSTIAVLTNTNVYVANTNAFGVVIPAGTHLWAGFREAMGTTQARVACLQGDAGRGYLLQAAASGVLTGAGPFNGQIPTQAIWLASGAQCANFWVTSD